MTKCSWRSKDYFEKEREQEMIETEISKLIVQEYFKKLTEHPDESLK
jgi:hypothetical protein